MNCTVCGKPHTKEQPLTVAHNGEWLCPGCLKELDIDDIPLYGKSPLDYTEAMLKTGGALRNSVVVTNGVIKVGNVELPIESFEMR